MTSMTRLRSVSVMAVPEGRPVRLDLYRDPCNFLCSFINFAMIGGPRISLAGGRAATSIEKIFCDLFANNSALISLFACIRFLVFDCRDPGIEYRLGMHWFLSEAYALRAGGQTGRDSIFSASKAKQIDF